MNVVFRADASIDIGTGHVMRCLTLANALRDVGANCHFICREHAGNLIYRIKENGFDVTALPVFTKQAPSHEFTSDVYSDWLGADWETDASQTSAALKVPVDWLVTDHYAIDHRWESRLRSSCHKLMAIDDLADRDHECDILLDQNLGRTKADYAARVPADCIILCDPRFALLRPEFAAQRFASLARRKSGELCHLLINMGGVDKINASSQVLLALRNCVFPETCTITVVMGLQAPWLAEVRHLAAAMPWSTEVLVDVSNMAELMAASDLAIGAAGSTSWERCALGLPSVVVVLAQNQESIATALHATGAASTVTLKTLEIELQALFTDRSALAAKLITQSAVAQRIADGLGCEAVAEAMLSKVAA